MVPDRQKVRTDGQTEWTDGQTDGCTDDAKTISLRLRRGIKNVIPKVDHGMVVTPQVVQAVCRL